MMKKKYFLQNGEFENIGKISVQKKLNIADCLCSPKSVCLCIFVPCLAVCTCCDFHNLIRDSIILLESSPKSSAFVRGIHNLIAPFMKMTYINLINQGK